MTSVRFYRDGRGRLTGFSAIGHAGSAPHGEDIVCAGVSSLTLTAINALEAVAGIVTSPRIGDGYVSVRLPKGLDARQTHDAQVILRTVQEGIRGIAASYPQYVRVS